MYFSNHLWLHCVLRTDKVTSNVFSDISSKVDMQLYMD